MTALFPPSVTCQRTGAVQTGVVTVCNDGNRRHGNPDRGITPNSVTKLEPSENTLDDEYRFLIESPNICRQNGHSDSRNLQDLRCDPDMMTTLGMNRLADLERTLPYDDLSLDASAGMVP